jgi:CubicO group peptidase (beta-lactamase class C family)
MEPQKQYWPTSAWRTTTPEAVGMKPDDFQLLHQYAEEDQRIQSLLVIRSGYIVFEEYYHGGDQSHYHNVNSVTKNVTSALVGIALREKWIETVNQSIFSFFPEYASLGKQEQRNAIHLHHLLSLTSGFTLMGEISTFLEHTASLEQILSRPVAHKPGQVFSYDDIDIHLISLILARVTGRSVAKLAQTYLFEPLGIWLDEQGQAYPWRNGKASEDRPHPWGLWNGQDDKLWSVDRQGNPIGAFGLQLTTHEIAKLGYLYLHQGQWDGQQIIPAEYVKSSLTAYTSTPGGTNYGYCWYLPRFQEHDTFWAIGFGGQLIVCFPDLDLLFAMTAQPEIGKPSAHIKIMDEAFAPLLQGKL